uniref:Protein kinase domain-containing protein n=1 Tax=Parastrongyloides trichosuri TaxID=131310 RepID=A0A0N4ZDU5_PARTI
MFAAKSYEKLCVEDSNISFGWIVECLVKNSNSFKKIKGDSKILKFDFQDISDGKGFISKVYKSTAYFDGDDKKVFQFITKIPGLECLTELFESETDKESINKCFDASFVSILHDQECTFYGQIMEEIGNLKAPKCYGMQDLVPKKQDGCLIMEYLSPNASNLPFYESFNVYQIKSALSELMKFQVFSLTNGKHWTTKFKNHFTLESFNSIYKLVEINYIILNEFVLKK